MRLNGWQLLTIAALISTSSLLVAGVLRDAPTAETIITPPRIVTFPAPLAEMTPAATVADDAPLVAEVEVVERVTVVQTFESYLDDLDRRFDEQNALDIWPIIAVSQAAEEERGEYVPTLENAISPAFTETQIATRWMTPEEFRLILAAAGWADEELDQAYRVARCESPATLSDGPFGWLDVIAIGPGLERGLFQIIPAWFTEEAAIEAGMNRALFADFDLFDPLQNAIAALVLWRNGGWSHWECFNQGKA